MRRHTPLLLLTLALLILTACQELPYHIEYRDLPHSQWDSRDTLTFPIPPTDHDRDLHLTLSIRTTSTFPYADIVTRLQLLCDSQLVSSTPIPVTLHDGPQSTGPAIPFDEHNSRPQPLHLQAHRHYTLRLTHLMRLNPLDGIPSVGVIIE